MDKNEIRSFWNYSRMVSNLPEKMFVEKNPLAIDIAKKYDSLAMKYLKFFGEVNHIAA